MGYILGLGLGIYEARTTILIRRVYVGFHGCLGMLSPRPILASKEYTLLNPEPLL